MKYLLKKVSFFLLPLLGLFLFLEIKLSQIPTYLSLKKEFLESQLDQIEILSTGLSYGNSINPQFFDRKGFNLFNDAEDLYFDVKVIEKYFDRMPNLKIVLLPISYFSLEYRQENSQWSWRAPFYKFIFNIQPSKYISIFNPSYYSYALAYGWKDDLNFIYTNFSSNMTKYMHENGWREIGSQELIDSKETDRAGRQSIEYAEVMLMDERNIPFNMQLLSSFIEKCIEGKVKVILYTPPTFHNYYDHINPIKYQKIQTEISRLTEKYHLEYFDFLKDSRFSASDFYSIDHVNDLGAEKLSRIMNTIINKILTIPSA